MARNFGPPGQRPGDSPRVRMEAIALTNSIPDVDPATVAATPIGFLVEPYAKATGIPHDAVERFATIPQNILTSGLPSADAYVARELALGKKLTLIEGASHYPMVASGNFIGLPVGSRQQRRAARNMANLPTKNLEKALAQNHPTTARIQENIQRTKAGGLYRCTSLAAMMSGFYACYTPEAKLDQAALAYDLQPADRTVLFGAPDAGPRDVNGLEVTRILRGQKRADISQPTLDARTNAFLDALNIELTTTFLADVREMGGLGGHMADRATALFRRHRTAIAGVDIDPKVLAIKELAMAFWTFAENTPDDKPLTYQLLKDFSRRTGTICNHVYHLGNLIAQIYGELNYTDLPDRLHEIMDDPEAVPEAPLPTPVQMVEEEAAAPSAEPEVPLVAENVAPEDIAAAGLAENLEEIKLQRSIAEQLDEIILPNESNGITPEEFAKRLEEAVEEMAKSAPGEHKQALWARLQDLVALCTHYGGKLYRSKEQSLGTRQPYFVAVFKIDGDTYAVAESPSYAHSTYIVSQKHVPGTWLEVLTLKRKQAQAVGAVALRHSQSLPHGDKRVELIKDIITSKSLAAGI